MKHFILIVLVILSSCPFAHSQILKGKITNQSGEHTLYATVYIQELKQGTTSNTKGDYEIRLPADRYTVIYQSLGYQSNYTEIGYSISEILFVGELGVYGGFDDTKYKSVGVRAVLNFH